VTSFQSSIPSLTRSFHQSRIWRAEEQKKEAETTSSTAQDAVSESSGTTSEPLGQSEHQSQTVSESASATPETPSSSSPSTAQDAVSESSGTTSDPIGQSEHESKPVLDQAAELAEKAKETVSDVAAKAAQAVGEITQQPQQKAHEAAVNVSQQAQETASKVSEQAQETASKVGEQAQYAASSTARAARDTAASTRDTFRNDRRSEPREPAPASKILYVGNLFFEVTAPALEAEFAKYGEVSNSRVITDNRGLSKGFAYIEFANQEQADAAVASLDQKVFQGRRLSVQYHKRRTTGTGRDGAANSTRGAAQPSKTLFIGNMSYQMSDRDLNGMFSLR
jgi:nucleolin